MATLLMIVSSAQMIRLADGSDHPPGYQAEEIRVPYETFVAAWWAAARRCPVNFRLWSAAGIPDVNPES
jgi:hypothetical protein